MNNDFELQLTALLDQAKSQKMINADIKALEKAINSLRLVATFSKTESKKELNAYIKQLSNQLSTLKLKGKLDEKSLKREINESLHNMTFKEIDALNVDGNKAKLKIQKVVADMRAFAEKTPISVNVQLKKEKLGNDLTTFLNKNSKTRESSVLIAESERIRELIDSVNDKGTLRNATDAFSLFKSEVVSTGYAGKSTAQKIKDMLTHITKIGSFFGLASMAVNNFRKSLSTLKSNDTILTEISKTAELTRKQLEELGDEAFKVASKYGQLSGNYLLGVQEMSRAGYENADSMAELSTKVQGAGDMTAELANQYIIATDKAYKLNGSIGALTTTLDGANNITNNNAVNMSQLAEGMSIVGSQAASAGMEVNETTAALSTMIAVTQQGGSQMANAFKGILMNLQQVTGEVEDGGDAIDAESLTKYEKACNELGVSLSTVRDGIVSLREPMQIIRELSEAYVRLDETDARRANLLSSVGGKYRANALNAILENYDLYEKMLQDYADGLGSMDKEAEKTAKSWEGRLNSLQNSFDSFVNTITNKEAILGGISFFDRLIQGAEEFTNAVGEIPVVLTALNSTLVATNKDYGISQIWNKDKGKFDIQGNLLGIDFTAVKNMKQHFSEAEGAIAKWNAVLVTGNADINKFGEAVVQNNVQFKEYLSTCSTDAPASLEGYKSHLKAAGVATDTLRLKTVMLNAAISMGIGIAIQLAMKGVILLVQKIDDLVHASEKCKERVDELMSSYQSALDKANSNAKTIENLASRYEELSKGVNRLGENVSLAADEYSEYNDIVNQIAEMFPTLIQGYTNEGNAILSLKGNVEQLRDAYKEAQQEAYNMLIVSGEDSDGNDIIKNYQNQVNSNFNFVGVRDESGARDIIDILTRLTGALTPDEFREAYSQLQQEYKSIWETDKNIQDALKQSGFSDLVTFDNYATMTSDDLIKVKRAAQAIIQTYQAEINSALKNVQTLANAYLMTNEDYTKLDEQSKNAASIIVNSIDENIASGFDNKINVGEYVNKVVGLIKDNPEVQDALIGLFSLDLDNMPVNEAKELIDIYIGSIAGGIKEDELELKVRLGFDDTVDTAKRLQNSIRQITDNHGITDREEYADLSEYTKDFKQAQAELWLEATLGAQNATEAIKMYEDAIAEVENTDVNSSLSISDLINQLNTQLKPTFDSLKSAYQDIFTSDGYNPNAVDISMLDSIKSSLEKINELEDMDITIDMDAFDTLATTLTDVNTTENQAKEAFNDFATSIFYATNATNGMTDETKELVEQLLESLGIVNATEVAEYALAEAKEKDVLATHDLAMASIEDAAAKENEFRAILAEGEAAGLTRQQIYNLTAAEIAFGQNNLNTEQKIEQLRNLAKAYGDTASAALATAIANDLASGHTDTDTAINNLMAQINAGVQKVDIDFSPIEKSAAKAGSSAGKSYADALKDELSNLNSVINYIGDTIDKQIDLFEDQKDAAVEALEAEQKAAEEALEAEKALVQEKIDAKQAEIDAIEEAAIARKNEFNLQKAQYEWQRMLNQRTILQFSEGKGIHYVIDTKEAREAHNAVTEAQENIQIADLQKDISGLNDIIDDLDKKIEESNEYYDKLIEETEKYWDGLIKGLEDYKSRWKELADIEEQAKMEVALRNLGITTEDVLNMSESAFESFKGTYLGLLNQMYSGNDEMVDMLQRFGGISTDALKPLSGTISDVAASLDNFAGSTGNANASTSAASESVGNLNTNTAELNGNLSGVSDTLDHMLEDNKLETVAEQMGDIAESVQSVSDALNDMPTDLDMSEPIAQFDALGNSVDKVSASISGGTASKAESGEPSGKNVPNAQSNSGNGSGNLVGAIKEVKSETDRSIGTGEGSGAIGQFNQLGQSVTDVTAAIGGSESKGGNGEDSSDLISSIENLGETTVETLGEPDGEGAIGKFGELGDVIADAENHTQGIIDNLNELDGMTAECTIKVNVETNGSIPAFAEGTVNTDFESGEFTAQYGHAFAEGTGKYQGLPKAEKNALVSEYGQTEMTVLPNGDTIITDEPTLMDLPKDTVIYNEEQTKKIMDNKIDVSGKAYAGGTVDGDKFITPDGQVFRPLQPGSERWDMMQKFQPLINKILDGQMDIASTAMFNHQKQMEQLARDITTNNVINNIANNRPTVTFGDIHVTCPGVTEQQVARYVPGAVKEELRKEFTGFSNYADQWSRR